MRLRSQWTFALLGLSALACRPSDKKLDAGVDQDFWSEPSANRPIVRIPSGLIALQKSTLRAAIEYLLPYMVDEHPLSGPQVEDPRLGAKLLRDWGRQHLSWESLGGVGDAELDEIAGHRGEYRGTLVCVRAPLATYDFNGAVLEPGENVAADAPRTMRRQARVLLTHAGTQPVLGRVIRACGVFTGVYTDLREGAVGILLVGMLDTPDNRLWIPPEPRRGDMDGARPSAPRLSPYVPL